MPRISIQSLPPKYREAVLRQLPAKPRKYRNQPVEVGGEKFDSKHEERQYRILEAQQARGEIAGLRRQVKFSLFDPGGHCPGEHIGTYTADFVFRENGALRVADAKSAKTKKLREWARTKKLMRACHGIDIVEL